MSARIPNILSRRVGQVTLAFTPARGSFFAESKTMTQTIASKYQIQTHGVMYPDYFQGAGVMPECYWETVATGVGETEREALDDALESLAQQDWLIGDDNEKAVLSQADDSDVASAYGDDSLWFVSVFVR